VSAVILDVDGTLVDSRQIHVAAFEVVLRERGQEIDPRPYLGLSTEAAFAQMIPELTADDAAQMAFSKRERATELMESAPEFLVSGAIEVMRTLSRRYRLALCSSGSRRTLEVAQRRGLPIELCDVIITADDCPQSKPHPGPYEACLASLELRPDRAIAIEDTEIGARAASAAGIRCVRISSDADKDVAIGVIGASVVRVPDLVSAVAVIDRMFSQDG